MKSISWRAQLWCIAFGYAAVGVIAGGLLFGRYWLERNNPDAAGGMYAFGDLILYIFVVFLFMVPTLFLVWVMARSEPVYAVYSQLLMGISLSAPVCLSLLLAKNVGEPLRGLCLVRLVCGPFVLVGIGVSRLVARFDRAKKLASYALLIEGLTLAVGIGLLIRG